MTAAHLTAFDNACRRAAKFYRNGNPAEARRTLARAALKVAKAEGDANSVLRLGLIARGAR